MTSEAHLPVLKSTRQVSVRWITDIDRDKARAVAAAYRIPYGDSLDQLLNLTPVDIVLLAIPYGARAPYHAALRERSCALYIEKPIARSILEHRELCSGFPDFRLAAGFQKRSWGPTLFLRQLLDQGPLGPLRRIRYGFGAPGIVVSGRYNAELRLAGGGILFETAIHGLDALLFCTRAIAVEAVSASMIMDNGFDLHTAGSFLLLQERGEPVPCEILVSCLQETIQRLEFHFDHAVASLSLFSGNGEIWVTTQGGSESLLSPRTALYPLTAYQTHYEHWQRFLSGLADEKVNWTSVSQSALTTSLVENLYASGTRSPGSRA